ncbi:CofH family radical SAM protein [Simkania negevensis]|uniref:CofH family radical SAM protein n=1 Tax=Simkania negevensis TaxID=83561 RepID=A0ABS3ASS7_9BACT|nr:CofH family radical SAM protein [Simkania negevensis]
MTLTLKRGESTDEIVDTMPTAKLRKIAQKAIEGERFSFDEGCYLFTCEEGDAVALLADYARKKHVGDIVYYASTLYIHPTNLCELSCPMCSFYAKPGWDKAWFLTPEQIEQRVKANLDKELTEIHFVGGLWRDCNLDYYQDAFERIKALDSALHIKALSAVEYDFLAKMHGITIEEVFDKMMSWGLGSLPGGGAEILVEHIRKQLAPQKITSEEYLDIHRKAHSRGLRSNITMLFGHVEEPEHIITHLCRVRELQDETQGFNTFVPLKYHEENNALGKRKKRLKSKDLRRVYSVSRLMLDNVKNLKVLWNYVGVEEAQAMLRCGANDFSATSLDEQIIVMAGGIRVKMTNDAIDKLITSVGRTPQRIHSGHDYQC